MVLIDVASRLGIPDFRVFTLDTDFLFPETYALIENIEKRNGIAVERAKSEFTPEAQATQYGEALWASQPDQCCDIRKVEPLKKQLAGLRAWVTGVRRDQAPTRANTRKLEWDAKFKLVKLNPLAGLELGRKCGTTFARTACSPTIRCTTGTIPASVARIAHARCNPAKTRARGAGRGKTRSSAGCTSKSSSSTSVFPPFLRSDVSPPPGLSSVVICFFLRAPAPSYALFRPSGTGFASG